MPGRSSSKDLDFMAIFGDPLVKWTQSFSQFNKKGVPYFETPHLVSFISTGADGCSVPFRFTLAEKSSGIFRQPRLALSGIRTGLHALWGDNANHAEILRSWERRFSAEVGGFLLVSIGVASSWWQPGPPQKVKQQFVGVCLGFPFETTPQGEFSKNDTPFSLGIRRGMRGLRRLKEPVTSWTK